MVRTKSLANYTVSVLSKIMNWAEEQDLPPLQPNPCFKLKSSAAKLDMALLRIKPSARSKFPDSMPRLALRNALPGKRDNAVVGLQFASRRSQRCGTRCCEVRSGDADWKSYPARF